MIVCLDAHYRDPGAIAAGLWFQLWQDSASAAEVVLHIERVEPYQSGQFYRRELPCLLAVLEKGPPAEIVVIDGYVWLEDEERPGLGAHLYRALGEKAVVIGVAKTRYPGATLARELRRGTSRSPLYITAAGMDAAEAAQHIAEMHGPYRIPTLLKRVDQLCRRTPPRLIADAMLGALARWLRALDVDVAYDPALDDAALVARAVAEGRTILTRDRRLIQRRLARDHLLIRSEVVDEQVRQVLDELGVEPDPGRFLGRCLRCNTPLEPIEAERARARVPPWVARTQEEFRACPACGRIYWPGTHVRRMAKRLERMLFAKPV